MTLTALMWIVVLLPLVGVVLSTVAEAPRRAAQICLVLTGLAAVLAVVVAVDQLVTGRAATESAITFWTFTPTFSGVPANPQDHFAGGSGLTDFHLQIGLIVDALSVILVATVAVLSFLVQLHSAASLRGDVRLRRHAMLLALLTAVAMATLSSANLFTFLAMWVLSGVIAALMTGLDPEAPPAGSALRRLVEWQRAGELLLLAAMVFAFDKIAVDVSGRSPLPGHEVSDPFNFATIAPEWQRIQQGLVPGSATRTLVVLSLLVLAAVMVRSPLVPLHGWWMGTTQAPAPTVGFVQGVAVTAGGVVLLARMYPLFVATPHMLALIAVVGALTAATGALLALCDDDVASLLTALGAGQLGLALVGLGTGAYAAGLFVLVTRAIVVVALYVAVGNLVVAYRSQRLGELAGARRRLPTSSLGLLLAGVAAAGAGLTGTFWSFRDVLAGVLDNTVVTGPHLSTAVQVAVLVLVVIAGFLGAAAPVRLLLRALGGTPVARRGFVVERLRESSRRLAGIAVILGGLAVLSGLGGIPGVRGSFLHIVTPPVSGSGRQPLSIAAYLIAIVVTVMGSAAAVIAVRRPSVAGFPALSRLGARISGLGDLDHHVDDLAERGLRLPARAVSLADRVVLTPAAVALADAVEFAAIGVEGKRAQRGSRALATMFVVAVVLGGGLMLAASGHLPLLGAR